MSATVRVIGPGDRGALPPVSPFADAQPELAFPESPTPGTVEMVENIARALRAEGVPGVATGYQNLHLLPAFRNRIAYGTQGFPWTSPHASRQVTYGPGTCPVAEELHSQSFLGLALCVCEFTPADIAQVVMAFRKVWSQLDTLKTLAPASSTTA